MKKLPLLITIGIIALFVGAYFAYQYLQRGPVKAWDLIPTDAILVYEKDNCKTCVDQATQTTLWSIIERVSTYHKTTDTIRNQIRQAVEKARGVLVSAHVTKKDEMDFIYYIPSGADFLKSSGLASKKNHNVASRVFNGVTISEVRFDKQVFSLAVIEGILVGSFTPFLVEDVVRTFRTGGDAGKQLTFGSLQFASVKDDAGNLYVRIESLQELFSVITDDIKFNYEIGRSALLDIKADDNSLTLNGFSTDSIDNSKYFLSIFRYQNPVSLGLKQLISNRVVAVTGFGVSDGGRLYDAREKFLQANRSRLKDSLAIISRQHSIDFENLYGRISDEVAVCYMETSRKSFSKILLIETSDINPWIRSFKNVANKLSVDTIFYERYAQYDIREIPIYQFSEKLFWPLASGFTHNFYTTVGKVLVIAEDVEQLKNFLDDIEAEETWGRSVAQNRFLEGTLLESNVSIYVNTWRFLNTYALNFQPRWQAFVKDNKSMLQALQMSSIQFSHLNNSYYTNALFTFKPLEKSQVRESINANTVTMFDKGVSSLSAVRSHVNRSNEVLVQDSLNDLSLISADGKVLWRHPIGERIVGEITQVDFFNNGKLQYFFATQFSLHVIDRLGNYVNPFPIAHNITDVEFVNVIDYDNSKKYRFLLSDKIGKVYMFDKEGSVLDGWKPNDAGAGLTTSPRHYRIKGKDYIIGVRKDGIVNLWTRRGEMIRNFPVDLHAEPIGDVFLERGNTLEETHFILVTRDGFRIRLTAEGKVHSKETLLRSSIRSTFSLLLEKSGKSYLIVQQDERELTIADADGRKVVSVPVTGTRQGDIKFNNYGSGKDFIAVKDNGQGLYYLYDGQGNLLFTPPVEAEMMEVRPVDSDEFMLFFIHGRSLVMQRL